MKTDKQYIYPETPEELSAFYGWECENFTRGKWENKGKLNFWACTSFQHPKVGMSSDFRFKLPRLSDLVVGDVVQGDKMLELTELDSFELQWLKDNPRPVSLLVSRGVWVEVLP